MIKAKFKHLRILKFNWGSISGQCTIFLTTIICRYQFMELLFFLLINVAIHRKGVGQPIVMGRELPIYLYKIIENNMGIATNEITNIILSQLQHKNPFPLCRYYHYFGMEKLNRTWFCRRYQHQCTYAHIQALKDYYMLVGHTITNRKCCAV